jgi:hypothetical protein
LKDITRLLGSWPSAAAPADGEEQLRSYMLAVEDYHADDVTAGVDALIKGTAPGVNPSFLPPPAVVGAECHRQNHLRTTREARDKALRPALPPPMVEHSAESRARVKALVDKAVGNLSVAPEEDPIERHRRIIARTNERFDAERGFTVGDDGEEAA